VHVCLGPGARSGRVTPPRAGTLGVMCGVIAVIAVMATWGTACARHGAPADDVTVEWKMTPTPPIVGAPALGEMMLRDRARRPVRGALLQVVGHMSHPGMPPVIAAVAERGDGVYQVHLQFTMSGDWVLLVTGSLPDGRRLDHRIDIAHARPAG
jgi:hypothetical protein